MKLSALPRCSRAQAAFSLTEVLVSVVTSGFMFLTMYAGFSSGFAVVELARENLRGTQILQEKTETLRLYNWDQLTDPNFIPATFVETFYPGTQSAGGLTYTGKVTIASAPITETYSNDLRLVTVSVQWVSANVLRKREMTTMASRHGLQNYVY